MNIASTRGVSCSVSQSNGRANARGLRAPLRELVGDQDDQRHDERQEVIHRAIHDQRREQRTRRQIRLQQQDHQSFEHAHAAGDVACQSEKLRDEMNAPRNTSSGGPPGAAARRARNRQGPIRTWRRRAGRSPRVASAMRSSNRDSRIGVVANPCRREIRDDDQHEQPSSRD